MQIHVFIYLQKERECFIQHMDTIKNKIIYSIDIFLLHPTFFHFCEFYI